MQKSVQFALRLFTETLPPPLGLHWEFFAPEKGGGGEKLPTTTVRAEEAGKSGFLNCECELTPASTVGVLKATA